MGLLSKYPGGDEEAATQGFSLDLERMVCPTCGREMPPWQTICKDDGATLVRRNDLVDGGPEVPAHLRDDATEK